MITIINYLCLAILVAASQTGNWLLTTIACIYLTLSSLGCVSVLASELVSESLEWSGWPGFIWSSAVAALIGYLTIGTFIGGWYIAISVFWLGATILTKDINSSPPTAQP